MCPGSNGITFHVLKLQDIEGTEEITYAMWDNGNLIKKPVSISVFKDELPLFFSFIILTSVRGRSAVFASNNIFHHCTFL